MRPSWKILQGDCIERMRELPAGSVQCCVTSPPYFNLRDYGTATWEGGDANCEHRVRENPAGTGKSTLGDGKKTVGHSQEGYRSVCGRCGARRIDKQIGLERTPEEYVANLVTVFREVRRVLRDDGTCWMNLGDSYAASRGQRKPTDVANSPKQQTNVGSIRCGSRSADGYKPKDLMGIPWRVAFALQADGWWLRSDIVWHKPSVMPESVTDRPTKAHEYLFLLSKSKDYFYDADAIREPLSPDEATKNRKPRGEEMPRSMAAGIYHSRPTMASHFQPMQSNPSGRNKRSVWTVPVQAFEGAHFATYPPKLIEPCILAGTSERGCCSNCGAPWERVTQREQLKRERPNDYTKRTGQDGTGNSCANSVAGVSVVTTGWQPTCDCNAEIKPCIVLDPFGGSGTTAQVAVALGREAIICELNADYIALAEKRIRTPLYKDDLPPKQVPSMPGQKALFGE